MANLEQQSLFSFLLILKDRTNSFVDTSKPHYILAKQYGMSVNTFTKYWTLAQNLGFTRKKSYYHTVISWKVILRELCGIEKNRHFKKLIDKKNIKSLTLNQIRVWFYKCLALYNLTQQSYMVEQNEKLRYAAIILSTDDNKGKFVKKMHYAKLCKQAMNAKTTLKAYCARFARKLTRYIKTGSYHLASKIGLSHNTANKCLKALNYEGFIKRTIVYKIHKCEVNHYNFDNLKDKLGRNNFYYSSFVNKFVSCKGSKILLSLY